MANEKNTKSTQKEDPEEVAAREAGEQAPIVEEADKKVLRENAKAEKEANTDEDGEEVDPAVHEPVVEKARKV
jgi:hypothetical protein